MKLFKPTTIMKRFFTIGLIILFSICQLNAWELLQPTGGRTNSLGKCSVTMDGFWSLHNNPAGFASYQNLSFGISYENKFLLKELGTKDAGLILPFKMGNIGISYSQFGYENYNENTFGLGIAKSLGPNFNIGIKLYYIFINFSGVYENKSAPTFDIGIQYKINEVLCLGVYVFNPVRVKFRSLNKDKIPIIMRLGLSYLVNDDFLITGEIEENFGHDFSFRFGLEYEIYKNFLIRGGFQFKPEMLTFGVGYDYKYFIIEVSAQMNQRLGTSLSSSIIFKINKRNTT